ncbi:MAG: histidinol dehydrogenase, partial [Amphritea sp.]|nr:histidinol dehydrogenase [Amphritea sp.]
MAKPEILRLDSQQSDFSEQLDKLLAWESVSNKEVNLIVGEILERVKAEGDKAVVEYTNRFDRLSAGSMKELEFSQEDMQRALENLPADQYKALTVAAQRVRDYHERQKGESWQYQEADGTLLGQKVTPMEKAG